MKDDWVEASLAELKVARTMDIYIMGAVPCGHTVLSRAIADGEIFARYRGETKPRPSSHWASVAEEQMQFTGDREWYSIPTRDLEVSRDMLHRWVKKHESSVPRPHRPKGTGKQATDSSLVQRMHALIIAGKANSRTDAASQILKEDGDNHGASFEASQRRLRDRYTATYGE